MSDYKVIFHIDEMSKWQVLLGNVSNLLNGIADTKLHVIVLANSEAVKSYETNQGFDAVIHTMESLNKEGVKFVACNNALMAYKMEKDDLIPFVDIVPAGIVELVKKQSEGYIYIKP